MIILNDRTLSVQQAQAKLSMQFWKGVEEYGLTDGEVFMCLSIMMQSAAKYMIRSERHPDTPEKPGDTE